MKTLFYAARTALLLLIVAIVFVNCQRDEPLKKPESEKAHKLDSLHVTLKEAIEVAAYAGNSASGVSNDSSARIGTESDEIVDQVIIRDSTDGSPLLYIFKKAKGFAIVSADFRVMPILAFSDKSEIEPA